MTSSQATVVREDGDEFFVGYAPPMPPRLARYVSRVVIGLACGVLAWAVTLGAGHAPLEGGTFEFGHPQRFAGTLVERPYPALRSDGAEHSATPWLLLVAPGKHGADALVRGLDGRHVTLAGTRVRRGAHTMIEVDPASLVADDGSASSLTAAAIQAQSFGDHPVKVRGEIVDSKCFLGVMVPGSGKTHKDCASLCLRGGIPPALYVQDRAGQSALLLVTGASGEPIGARALQVAGEAIDMTGIIEQQGGWLVLRTDPHTWQPVESR
ncbi:MAG: hypothetical protein ABJA98_26735 [Acidobacteriota bacterium]